MSVPSEHKAWWQEPMVWLIAGLPASAVVAGLATVMIAAHKPDSLVTEEHAKQGMAINKVSTRQDKAAELALSARLDRSQDGNIRLELAGRLAAFPAVLDLTLAHLSQADRDISVRLLLADRNTYIGHVPDMVNGKRLLILEPEDRSWRLTGEWETALSRSAGLDAGANNPSTHPQGRF
jgi:hypothetical protein